MTKEPTIDVIKTRLTGRNALTEVVPSLDARAAFQARAKALVAVIQPGRGDRIPSMDRRRERQWPGTVVSVLHRDNAQLGPRLGRYAQTERRAAFRPSGHLTSHGGGPKPLAKTGGSEGEDMRNSHHSSRNGRSRLVRAARAVLAAGAFALVAAIGVSTESVSAQGTAPPQWDHRTVSFIRVNENAITVPSYPLSVEPSSGDHRYVSFSVIGGEGWRVENYGSQGYFVRGRLIYSGDGLDHEAYPNGEFSFTLRASDWNLHSDHTVRMQVDDVVEVPGTPNAPSIQPKSNASVHVLWDEPANTGPPMSYRLRYRHSDGEAWQTVDEISRLRHRLRQLVKGEPVIVSVQAYSDEGESEWSPEARLEPLRFQQNPLRFDLPENARGPAGGLTLGVVQALRGDEHTAVSYELLDYTGKCFGLVKNAGGQYELRYFGDGEDYEDPGSGCSAEFNLRLEAADAPYNEQSSKPAGTATANVIVTVTDLPEVPPEWGDDQEIIVRETQREQVTIVWSEPSVFHGVVEPVLGYVLCAEPAGLSGSDCDGDKGMLREYGAEAAGTYVDVTGFEAGTSYQVKVKAENRYGWSPYSEVMVFTTEPPNRPPRVRSAIADVVLDLGSTQGAGHKARVALAGVFEDPDESDSDVDLTLVAVESSDADVARATSGEIGSPLANAVVSLGGRSVGVVVVTVTVRDDDGLTASDEFTVTVVDQ